MMKKKGFSMAIGDIIQGGISGAGTGAAIGGPWGALAGGALGALGGGLSSRKRKAKAGGNVEGADNYNVLSTLNPQQQQLFQQLASQLLGQNLTTAGSPTYQAGQNLINQILGGDTEAFEAPLMRQFQEQIIPGIAERFSGLGAGAQRSSAFQQALSQSAADLTERLGSLRGQLGLSALGPALSYAQAPGQEAQGLLGMSTMALSPKQMGFWKQLGIGTAGGIGSGLGQLAGLYALNKFQNSMKPATATAGTP